MRREQARGPAGATCRHLAVVAIKLLHNTVFAIVSSSVLHVFSAGVRGRSARYTGGAIVIVLAEMAVFAANRWRCPLTGLAESLGAKHGRVTDIFLPHRFADRIPQLYTPPFVIGVLAL